MNKHQVLYAMKKVCEEKAKQYNCKLTKCDDYGEFGYMRLDKKEETKFAIPTIVYESEDGYSVELRSFWHSPEIDISKPNKYDKTLLILRYTNHHWKLSKKITEKSYRVDEVRQNGENYIENINEIYSMIEMVENYSKEVK